MSKAEWKTVKLGDVCEMYQPKTISQDEMITDEMVECPTCKTYVSKKEAIVSNGKFYCSKECLLNK